jgi:hypothetical protein
MIFLAGNSAAIPRLVRWCCECEPDKGSSDPSAVGTVRKTDWNSVSDVSYPVNTLVRSEQQIYLLCSNQHEARTGLSDWPDLKGIGV